MTKLQLLFHFSFMVFTLMFGYLGLNCLPPSLYSGVFFGWSFYFCSSAYILIQQALDPKEEHLILFAPSFLVAAVLFALSSVIQAFPLWGSYIIAQFTVVALQGLAFYFNVRADDSYLLGESDNVKQKLEREGSVNQEGNFTPIRVSKNYSGSSGSADNSPADEKTIKKVRFDN